MLIKFLLVIELVFLELGEVFSDSLIDSRFSSLYIRRILFFLQIEQFCLLELFKARLALRLVPVVFQRHRRQNFKFLNHFFDAFLQKVTVFSFKIFMEEARVVELEGVGSRSKCLRNALSDTF